MKYLIWTSLILTLFCCKLNQQGGGSMNLTDYDRSDEVFLYITFEITEKDTGRIDVDLIQINRTINGGKLQTQEPVAGKKQITFQFLNKRKELLSEVTMENPLYKSYESYSQSGNVNRVQGYLDRAKMVVRSRVSKNVSFVKVIDMEGFQKIFEL